MESKPSDTEGWNAIVGTLPSNWQLRAAEMGASRLVSTPPERRYGLCDPATWPRLVLLHVATATPRDRKVAPGSWRRCHYGCW
jgi:hypothetical protein